MSLFLTNAGASLVLTNGGVPNFGADVAFVWDAVVDADSYVLQVGYASGGPWSRYDASVGNHTTYTLQLSPGKYWSRVVPYDGATPLTALDEQTVTV